MRHGGSFHGIKGGIAREQGALLAGRPPGSKTTAWQEADPVSLRSPGPASCQVVTNQQVLWTELLIEVIAQLSQTKIRLVISCLTHTDRITEPQHLDQKFKIILETSNLSEEDFGEYCRKKGIYASDVERWKTKCESALSWRPAGKVTVQLVKDKNAKIKKLNSQFEKLEKLNKRQEHEIDKRDKSLAVYAAKESVSKIFTSYSRTKRAISAR